MEEELFIPPYISQSQNTLKYKREIIGKKLNEWLKSYVEDEV